ncbi:MAG: hypothetical protein ACFFAN_21230, partial [Promethearchaeota archaeon]
MGIFSLNFSSITVIPENLIKRCYPELLDDLITKSVTIGRVAVVETSKPFSLFVSVALLKPKKKYCKFLFFIILFREF